MNPAHIATSSEIERVGMLGLEGLRLEWLHRYGTPPSLRSVGMLRHLLAWRIQAAAHGDLDRATRRALHRKGIGDAEGLHLGVGAKLTRVWKGRKYEVIVEPDGFCWNGKTFKSLSSVATAIVGSRWNGPRFFGLRDAA